MNACIGSSISRYFNKIDQIAFSELEKILSNHFGLFSVKSLPRYQEITVPQAIRIENSLDIF